MIRQSMSKSTIQPQLNFQDDVAVVVFSAINELSNYQSQG